MPEESTVSLKIYLMEGTNNIEIRRFEVDHGVITNYDYVRERLQMAIPKLREKAFKLLWQDSVGDEVTISSDEELMIALSELKSNVVKFIARIPSENSEPEAHIMSSMFDLYDSVSNRAEASPLFTELQDQNCHACQKPITGFRYRCLECVQYYQCGDCEHKKVHPDHFMIRMSKNPSMTNLIPKCMQIMKSHFIRGMRCPGMAFCDKMSYCHKKDEKEEKDRLGHHHHKKFRKHVRCDKDSSSDNEVMGECLFNPQMLGNLGDVVEAFLGMYKETQNKQQETAKQPESASTNSCPMKTFEIPSGSPIPSCPDNSKMEEDELNINTKDSRIKMAVDLLTEMGFNDDNKWLSRILEHFDGDIARIINYLSLGK